MAEIEIYFDNLSKEKQQEVLDAYGLESPEESWDDTPIAIICIEK